MHIPLSTIFSTLRTTVANIYSFLLQFLKTQNDKGKEYKPFFETFARKKIVGHHEN
jgi:hypothetical protein